MTAEAGALDRYREPIWTAGLQCVVLPWITPSGGRQAAVRMECGLDGRKGHSWTTKCLSWVSGCGALRMARGRWHA
jgi:hypothetical protein